MKTVKTITILAILLLSQGIFSQQVSTSKLPAPVKSAFANKFPSATGLKWEKEHNGNYEAKFMENMVSRRTEFDKNGNWVETEKVIKTSEVPKTVSEAVKKTNPGCKMSDAEEIQTSDKGMIYEVGCKTDAGKRDYRVSPEGKLEAKLEKK